VHGVIVGGGNAASSYRGRSSIRLDARRNEVKDYRGFRLNGDLRGGYFSTVQVFNNRSGKRDVRSIQLSDGARGFRSVHGVFRGGGFTASRESYFRCGGVRWNERYWTFVNNALGFRSV